MIPKVFLSLSGVDRDFVAAVRSRLPRGLAHFYEESFEAGEALLAAMERGVGASKIFVLFASRASMASPWVRFELDQARLQKIQDPSVNILVFPLDAQVDSSVLPGWLRQYWVPKAGWEPSDIARYVIHTVLSHNDRAAAQVVGRGKDLDALEQAIANSIQRTNRAPNVFLLAGVNRPGNPGGYLV